MAVLEVTAVPAVTPAKEEMEAKTDQQEMEVPREVKGLMVKILRCQEVH